MLSSRENRVVERSAAFDGERARRGGRPVGGYKKGRERRVQNRRDGRQRETALLLPFHGQLLNGIIPVLESLGANIQGMVERREKLKLEFRDDADRHMHQPAPRTVS